ncbi:putative mitochondrial phosphate carrier protein Pic2/Mir1 [Helianthus debilis subsp. tardiflorus]
MAFSDESRQSLIPNFLYTSSFSTTNRLMEKFNNNSNPNLYRSASIPKDEQNLVIPAPSEPFGKIEMYSPQFYAACTAGGILSCGLTHMTVTPLDLVKCNMQMCCSLSSTHLVVVSVDLFRFSDVVDVC